LDQHMASFRFVVVCGTTGSGKTRLLHALQRQGAQVLDLEALACHRSSVLGRVPGVEQPSQKHFDMQIWNALRQMDPMRPIFVEAESRKVGNLSVMDVLMDAMRDSPCIDLQLPQPERIALLMEEYPLFVSDTSAFAQRLDALINLKGKAVVDAWKDALSRGDVSSVVHSLLESHYDPTYLKSISRNFRQHTQALVVSPNALLEPHPVQHLLNFDLVHAHGADRDHLALEVAPRHGFECRVVKLEAFDHGPFVVAIGKMILRC
jgi:tRNA 2-selenouridine synthase